MAESAGLWKYGRSSLVNRILMIILFFLIGINLAGEHFPGMPKSTCTISKGWYKVKKKPLYQYRRNSYPIQRKNPDFFMQTVEFSFSMKEFFLKSKAFNQELS
jgi:hypothetical protein